MEVHAEHVSASLTVKSSAALTDKISALLSNRGMTSDEINRENLEILIYEAALPFHGKGGVQRLADKLDASRAQVSQWRNASVDHKSGKRRSMSAETCRRLEDACGKERGWMDVRHPELAMLITAKATSSAATGAGKTRRALTRGIRPEFLDAADKIIDTLIATGIFREALGNREELARRLARETRHSPSGDRSHPTDDEAMQNLAGSTGAGHVFRPAKIGQKKSPGTKQGDG